MDTGVSYFQHGTCGADDTRVGELRFLRDIAGHVQQNAEAIAAVRQDYTPERDITGAVVEIAQLQEILAVWVTDWARPFGIFTVYERVA